MNVHVFYDREHTRSNIQLENKARVKDLLKKMDINPLTALVSRNDSLLLEDESLDDSDEIKLISVISGG